MLTTFGIIVKKRMLGMDMTQKQLAMLAQEMSGVYCDQPRLSAILHGKEHSAKVQKAIAEILDIKNWDRL